MKPPPVHAPPSDALARRRAAPVIAYSPDTLPAHLPAATTSVLVDEILVPPRDARMVRVPRGHLLRIVSIDGPQVGDLNLWHMHDLSERFYSGKTRALHGTHLGVGDRLWSSFPHLRPMAVILADTLDWYGFDEDGASVHDVIGTRCDPYTNKLLTGQDFDFCCHSNLTRALAAATGLAIGAAEALVHDVLNVFMCTGFSRDTGQYFMKASPVRPGDYLEMRAEIDLLAGLSACPGGDCGAAHSNDAALCHPLKMEIRRPDPWPADGPTPPPSSSYAGGHGVG